MLSNIGSTAGDVWRFLDENGPTTVAKLKKNLKESKNISGSEVERAIGWLAREDKIERTEGKGEVLKARI
ncbi:hypothetical protein GF324_12800 [bacterium]|nr:hypothetical protein [bacterium]